MILRGEINAGNGDASRLVIPEAITSPVWVKSRSYNAASGEWSALNQAFFTTAPAASAENIVISQLHYHPRRPGAEELLVDAGFDQDDFEFVEVMNISDGTVDLGGSAFVLITSGDHLEGIEFEFPLGTLIEPGKRLVVAANSTAFAVRYPEVPLAGDYKNRLDNNGEWITLVDSEGNVIDSFRYNDAAPWPEQADGNGPSLLLNDPGLAPEPADPSSWTASLSADGSPGQEQLSEFTGDPLADADQDGVIAIMEYLGGLSDLVASSEGLPMFEIINEGGSDYLAITFRRDPRASDVAHFIEASEDLETWSNSETSELVTLVKTTTDGDGVPRHTYRLNVPMDGKSRQFIRLGVRY